MVVMLVVNAMGMLRLPAEMETYGMDLHEHGISAYPEYVISALGAPGGMTQELPLAQPRALGAAAKQMHRVLRVEPNRLLRSGAGGRACGLPPAPGR